MPETGITRSEIVNKLNLSLHGDLAGYRVVIGTACKQDPEFLAHLIAWDFVNGQIKDSKLALPVITLATREFPDELTENSLAHLAMQPPRELAKGLKFSIDSGTPARRQRALERMIHRYLTAKESEPGKWARLVARHRRSLKSLYAKTHCPMSPWASAILFDGKYIPGSIFADIANLRTMDSASVAATIQKWHLSPLVVSGALAGAKEKQKESAVVAATIDQMSDTETVTRAASLERKGITRDQHLKERFRQKVSKATTSKKATLKTSVAADEVEDEGLKTMLRELQERQIQSQKSAGRGIDGNWLVISDRSSSQEKAIKIGVHIAAAIAKFVTGTVWLAFCAADVSGYEVTGASLESIQQKTKFIIAHGDTSYGVGLSWAASKGCELDGVVIVGDGGENTDPLFAMEHARWEKRTQKRLPVYLYQTYCAPRYAGMFGGNTRQFESYMKAAGIEFTAFDLTSGKVDYFSIPNLVQSMNASRFGVIEKIMACPLITLDQVLGSQKAA